MKLTRILPLTALAASFSACGAADEAPAADAANREPAQQAAAIHACALVTRAEAESILGSLIADPEEQNSTGKSTCSYVGSQSAVTVMVEYPRTERVATSSEFAARLADDVKTNSADPEFAKLFGATRIEPVEGLGIPAALQDLGPASGGQLWLDAVKNAPEGGVYLRVMAVSLDVARAIAGHAAPRLP